eukprot:486756-Rhodomonas_salina.1
MQSSKLSGKKDKVACRGSRPPCAALSLGPASAEKDTSRLVCSDVLSGSAAERSCSMEEEWAVPRFQQHLGLSEARGTAGWEKFAARRRMDPAQAC